MSASKEQDRQHELAGFGDRVVAFALDMSLFLGGYFATLKLAFPRYSVLSNPHEGIWVPAWTALFLLFQAYMTSEGRVSPGKALVGIRVVSSEGEPLSLGQAVVRSLSYLPSSILNLGFLWSILHPARQCWHDMAVGSLVIESRRRSVFAHAVLRASAGGVLALIGGVWYWNNVARPRYDRIMDVAYAEVGLQEISKLQQVHRILHGRYAKDLDSLAKLSGEPEVFKRDMSRLFDAKEGIKIETDAEGFRVSARATDEERTLVAVSGS